MSQIADFLRVRIAERRAIAEAAAEDSEASWRPGDETFSASVNEAASGSPVVIGPWDYLDWDVRRHIAANDPGAVIADCDAKLALVDEHQDVNDGSCGTCVDAQWGYPTHGGSTPASYPCRTLCLLARPFVGHPDHKGTEWAP